MVDITIIGAGVAGLCAASELASRGARVRLVDRGGGPGPHGCSWWAGGMLAPECEGEQAEEPVIRLGRSAADWWERQGIKVTRAGTLVVAPGRDRRELDRFARRTSGHMTLDAAQIEALEPDLGGRFSRALFFETEAHLDPRGALAALQEKLRQNGIEIETEEVDPASIAGLTVDCRGLAARDMLSELRGVKGEMLVLHCPDVEFSRPIRLLHPRLPLYIVPRGEGVYMLGATVVEATERTRITARSLLELLSAAYALHPAFGEAEVLEIGVDARPAFPDNLPRIRREGDLIRANGLFRHGFLLGPALSVQIADLIFDDKTPEFSDENLAERGAA